MDGVDVVDGSGEVSESEKFDANVYAEQTSEIETHVIT